MPSAADSTSVRPVPRVLPAAKNSGARDWRVPRAADMTGVAGCEPEGRIGRHRKRRGWTWECGAAPGRLRVIGLAVAASALVAGLACVPPAGQATAVGQAPDPALPAGEALTGRPLQETRAPLQAALTLPEGPPPSEEAEPPPSTEAPEAPVAPAAESGRTPTAGEGTAAAPALASGNAQDYGRARLAPTWRRCGSSARPIPSGVTSSRSRTAASRSAAARTAACSPRSPREGTGSATACGRTRRSPPRSKGTGCRAA